jgi:hypothetical protein
MGPNASSNDSFLVLDKMTIALSGDDKQFVTKLGQRHGGRDFTPLMLHGNGS